MKKITAILFGAIVLLAACNKDKNKNDVTKENLIGTYKLAASVSQTGNLPEENDLNSMEACEKDNLLKLNADNTCNMVDAGTTCDPNGNENGSWSLPSTTQVLILDETWIIKSFNGRTLVIEFKFGSGDAAYRQTHTLIKQ